MVVWFAVIAAAGLGRIVAHPAIVKALSPSYGVEFFGAHPGIAFISLGAIVLTITGAEALYADMGHFGRAPISRAWFFVVFPALTLNYMGQGSLILGTPSAIDNPFFLLIPHWGRIPMVVLATVATVIASQSVISGAFSVTRQAVQLGFLPRLTIRHTSAREIGQVYVPAINWVAAGRGGGAGARLRLLDPARLRLRDRGHRHDHRRHPALPRRRPRALAQTGAGWSALGAAVFFTVDLAFLGANLTKAAARRLVPALGRRSPSSPCSAPGSAAARRSTPRGSRRRGRCAPSSRSCGRWTRRRCGCRAPPSTSTPAAKRRRWRCGRASSTTRPCTRRW